jgi:outer membrane murein-binding lipoprotein Lpp
MALGADDFHDLVSLLEQHPEWRAELRRLLLSEEILTLPELVRELVESQKRTDELMQQLTARVDDLTARMEQLTARVDDLAARMEQLAARVDDLAARMEQLTARVDDLTARMEQLTARVDDLAARMEQLTARVDDLAARMEQLTARVDDLTARMEQLTATVQSLTQSVQRIGDDVAKMKEFYLEQRYHSRAAMYFGRLIRRTRAIQYDDLCHILDDALDQGILTEEERDDLIETDVVVRGRRRTDGEEVYLIVEVSWGIGPHDVQRAARRARVFAKLGWQTMPVVAGGWANTDARTAAQQDGVIILLDGGQVMIGS